MNVRKLLLHEKVEVRQFEEGLRGSWYVGEVVGISDSCRKVEYEELLCESGKSKLVESIPVTGAIEGIYQRPCTKLKHRGHIRPPPPLPKLCSAKPRLSFGVCVDVLFEDAWWDGVIFDCDEESNERSVFFPDEGDECRFKVTDLRISQDWDEYSGDWRERGVWILVKLAKEHAIDVPPFHFIKRVWSHLRVNYGFLKMVSEWTCGSYCVWKKYFTEVVSEIATRSSRQRLGYPNNSRVFAVIRRENTAERSKCGLINGSTIARSNRKRKEKIPSQVVEQKQQYLTGSTVSENAVFFVEEGSGRLTDALSRKKKLASAAAFKQNKADENVVDGESDEIPNLLPVPVIKTVNSDACAIEQEQPHRMKSRVPEPKHVSVCKGEDSSFLNRGQVGQKELQSDVMLQQANGTGQNISSDIMNASFVENNKRPSQNIVSQKNRLLNENKVAWKRLKLAKSHKHRLKRYGSNGSKVEREIHGVVSYAPDNQSANRRKNLMMSRQSKGDVAAGFPTCSQGRRGRLMFHGLRNKKCRLKVKRKIPKKIQKAIAKSGSLSTKKEDLPSPAIKKDHILGSACHETLAIAVSDDEIRLKDTISSPQMQQKRRNKRCDSVCFICQYGDNLLPCDHCTSSYHLSCIDLKDVPGRRWFCPSCTCGLCGLRNSNSDRLFTEFCYQCSRQYHVDCLNKAGIPFSDDHLSDKFCSRRCFEICARLHDLLQTSNPTSMEGLTWTITRSRRNDCNIHDERVHPIIQSSQVLNVFHECFQPIIEPHTKRDLVADVVYNSGSKFRRLDFHGFYVMVLLNGEELACVATVRIHGHKVAEMPLVATPFKYRRQGMCRLLVHELEKTLIDMGVERLVLPAISQLKETWVSSFGFTEMSLHQRQEVLAYPFLVFEGTTLFQKVLSKSNLVNYSSQASQNPQRTIAGVSQVSQASLDGARRFGLSYTRRRKFGSLGKESTGMQGLNASKSALKYVYKRRRVQASRDSLVRH
ncbi:hypothetical protein Ancab_024337 [Ancistrocladus abbreviatus]